MSFDITQEAKRNFFSAVCPTSEKNYEQIIVGSQRHHKFQQIEV
jgi:hypothetical protein